MVLPRDRDELATVVAHAVAHKVPVTLRGRGSGNYGQCVPLVGIVIDLTEMKAIIDIGAEMVRVEAGCTLGMVEDALMKKDVSYRSRLRRCVSPRSAVSWGWVERRRLGRKRSIA